MNKSITCTISCQSNSYSCVVLTQLIILQLIKSNVHQTFELPTAKTTNCWCKLTFKKIGLNAVL